MPGEGSPIPGYGPEEEPSVPARHIMDPRLIRDFHQQHPEKPTKTSVGPGNPWCVAPPDPSDEEDSFSEREETSANDQETESTLEYRFTRLVFLTAFRERCGLHAGIHRDQWCNRKVLSVYVYVTKRCDINMSQTGAPKCGLGDTRF